MSIRSAGGSSSSTMDCSISSGSGCVSGTTGAGSGDGARFVLGFDFATAFSSSGWASAALALVDLVAFFTGVVVGAGAASCSGTGSGSGAGATWFATRSFFKTLFLCLGFGAGSMAAGSGSSASLASGGSTGSFASFGFAGVFLVVVAAFLTGFLTIVRLILGGAGREFSRSEAPISSSDPEAGGLVATDLEGMLGGAD